MNNTEKVFIILGFFVILIYFIHYFSLDSTIINLLGLSKESFQNHFFEPNQIFRHKNKIYLLDTRSVLEHEKNPLIFNSFTDYQKYVLSLEEDIRNKLKFKGIKLSDIKKEDIPPPKNKLKDIKEDGYDSFKKVIKCNKLVAKCNTNPYFASIFDPNELIKFQKKHCNKQNLTHKQCQDFEETVKRREELNPICNSSKMNEVNYLKQYQGICKKHNFYQNNHDIIEKDCQQKNSYEETCLLEDFFRENMLDSL